MQGMLRPAIIHEVCLASSLPKGSGFAKRQVQQFGQQLLAGLSGLAHFVLRTGLAVYVTS